MLADIPGRIFFPPGPTSSATTVDDLIESGNYSTEFRPGVQLD